MDRIGFPLVRVTWIDAASSDDWIDLDDVVHTCPTIVTVGHLIAEWDEGITLAMNYDAENESVAMTLNIPNHWIEDLRELKLV